MPKYLVQGSYDTQGLDGIMKLGGSSRRDAARDLVAQVGGTVEAFYFAFGADDFVCILDVPSNVDMTAVALTAMGGGMIRSRVTVLLSPEEVDAAGKKELHFRTPGH